MFRSLFGFALPDMPDSRLPLLKLQNWRIVRDTLCWSRAISRLEGATAEELGTLRVHARRTHR